MIISEANAKLWSRMGTRAAFGINTVELGKLYPDLMVLSADVRTSGGLEPFQRAFPEQYLEVGISEQNMICIAAGLASEGYRVITTTFAPFETMRCCEQIRVNLGYMQNKVCFVGLGSGLILGNQGFTHCCFEDIGVLRSIPNLTIISPADAGETAKAMFAMMEHNQSVYLRLTGGARCPIVYKTDYDFQIGKAITLREGADVAIIASGTMVHYSLKAAELLQEKGVSASVVNMHTIKPIDVEAVQNACSAKLIVTVEEHNVIGGLGSAVAEVLAELPSSPSMIKLGINDHYVKPGDYKYLLEKYQLTAQQIAANILAKM